MLLSDFNINTSRIKPTEAVKGFEIGAGTTSLMRTPSSGPDINKIDKFRVQVSLGSTVEKIEDVTANGYKVTFSQGDVCDPTTGEQFKSIVSYVC